MDDSLPISKDELEILKLKLEIQQASKPWHQRTWSWSVVLGILTLSATLIAAYAAWTSGLLDAKRERLANETALLEIRKLDLEDEIAINEKQVSDLGEKLTSLRGDLKREREYREALNTLMQHSASVSITQNVDRLNLGHFVSLPAPRAMKRLFSGVSGVHSFIIDPEVAEGLSKIQDVICLDLTYANKTDSGLSEVVAACPNLEELYFSDLSESIAELESGDHSLPVNYGQPQADPNELISPDLLVEVAKLRSLWMLRLDSCNVESTDLKSLRNARSLVSLSLAFCNGISDNSIDDLSIVTQLEELELIGTAITKVGAERLSKRLPATLIRGPGVKDHFNLGTLVD